jgi:hypothetical protein
MIRDGMSGEDLQKAAVAYFKVVSQNSPQKTKGNHENFGSG